MAGDEGLEFVAFGAPVEGKYEPPTGVSVAAMHTIEFTDEELRLVRNALQSFLEDFGHDEADVLRAVKQVLAKLPQPA